MSLDLKSFISHVLRDQRLAGDIVHREVLAGRSARFRHLNPPLSEPLRKALLEEGIRDLYAHQAEGVRLAREGQNVVTVTPTASGKTMVYALSILERVLKEPETRAILMFPLKALAQDQLKRLREISSRLELPESVAAVYDGDTSSHFRARIRRNPPNLLLTNPDMLHQGILPFHTQWETLFRNLRYIVIDELHTYKGVFGSHVLQVVRRLRRAASFYRSEPQFLATSATIANPCELAEQLTGLSFHLVAENGAPSTRRHMFFINPAGSLYTVATRLFTEAMKADQKTIVFTKARKVTELIHRWTLHSNPGLAGRISAYRAGYLPTERREIEHKLQSGFLKGVISTSALEMGIDIGGLDICILVGYPGTITATWQRAGRVGRKERDSAIFLIALPDALDQYFMRHPKDFFSRRAEAGVVDEANPYLLKNHLVCAAQEVPLRHDDPIYPVRTYGRIITELVEAGDLIEAGSGTVWFSNRKQPQQKVDIRGTGSSFTILEKGSRRLIGHVDGFQALTECHPGAVYLHGGHTYLVEHLDLGNRDAWVERAAVNHYTVAHTEKDTHILEVLDSREREAYTVSLGRLRVTERVSGYEKRNTAGREKLSQHELDLPPVVYETIGLWIHPPASAIAGLVNEKHHLMGSLHAIEHAGLALLPLFALCDRTDLGGISLTGHPQVGGAAVFLYDGHPGGVGLAARAYEVIDELLAKVLALVEGCSCVNGCPSCIHSPKCGHGNIPLDKQGCIRLLLHLNGKLPLTAVPVHDLPGGEVITICEDGRKVATESLPALSAAGMGRGGESTAAEGRRDAASPYVSLLPLAEGRHIVIFDLETQLSAEEVGGWQNAHLMRMSLGITYERHTGRYRTYLEKDMADLLHQLQEAELVVGFNQKRFDYMVLKAYTADDLSLLNSLDLLEEIYRRHGFRLGLGVLASATLGAPKEACGLDALRWWREGKMEEIERYCQRDVELTSRLFDHVLEHGYLLYENKSHGKVRLPLEIPLDKVLG